MGHGFGGTIGVRMMPYARRFSEAGLHVLAFDYRCFGLSDGEPRQLIDIRRQLEDWAAAIRFARTLPGVDPDRIALWGSSLSGGHVVPAAAQDGRVAAVVSQCPMMDARYASWSLVRYAGLRTSGKLMLAGCLDQLRGLLRQRPYRIPIVADPGHLAAMSAPGAYEAFQKMAPADFRNEFCARAILKLGTYRPGLQAHRLRCPILIQICEKDIEAPASAAEEAARRAGTRAEVRRYPIEHFDIYLGEAFEKSVSDQMEFLSRMLSGD